MRSRRNLARAAVALLALAFSAGVLKLFELRFDTGEVYPPYSTLRPDPLGAKAFYDSLELIPGLTVVRNTGALAEVRARAAAVVFMGVRARTGVEDGMAADLERLARGGARVAIAFLPEWPGPRANQNGEGPLRAGPQRPKKSFLETVGVNTGRLETTVSREEEIPVLGGVPRDTALYFEAHSPEWKIRRSDRGRPVALERAWYSGSLVLIADSWPLSNEALSRKPDAAELAWIVGGTRTVIFDESHLGIEETGSIAGLMRRYRLHGLLLALISLAALFVWSRSVSFIPKPDDAPESTPVAAGRSSSAGLVALLERTVPPAKLIGVCLDEWRTTPAGRAGSLRQGVDDAAREVAADTEPVRAYRHIRRTIEGLTHSWKRALND